MPFEPDKPQGRFAPDYQPDGRITGLPSRLETAVQDVGAALRLPGVFAGKVLGGVDTASKAMGGAATDAAAKVLPAEVAGAIGAATEILPQTVLGAGAGSKIPLGMEAASRRIMQSALKPTSEALANGNAAKAITFMLDEGVSATPSGAAQLRFQIDQLKKEVNARIANAPASTTVDKAWAASEVVKQLDKFKNQVNPTADLKAIKAAWEEFTGIFPNKIPLNQAQAVKEGTQAVLRDKYGKVAVTPATEAAEKAMARGMRLGIEDAVPGVGETNAALSQRINALGQIERRSGMAANRDIGGLVPVAESPEAAMLMLADRNPWVKSLLAQLLHSNKERLPAAAGGVAPNLYDVRK